MKDCVKRVLSLVLLVSVMLTLAGCGEIKKAEATVNNMFIAFKTLNFEEAEKYINVDEITLSSSEEDSDDMDFMSEEYMMLKALFGKLEHKIITSEKVDKDTVKVTVDVTAVEMKPILTEFYGNAIAYAFQNAFSGNQISDEEMSKKMSEMFMESASKSDLSMVNNTATITVVRKDKQWKVESNEEFVNAVLGGGITAAEEVTNEIENSFAQ